MQSSVHRDRRTEGLIFCSRIFSKNCRENSCSVISLKRKPAEKLGRFSFSLSKHWFSFGIRRSIVFDNKKPGPLLANDGFLGSDCLCIDITVGTFIFTFFVGTIKEIWASGWWEELLNGKIFLSLALFILSSFIPKLIKIIKASRAAADDS